MHEDDTLLGAALGDIAPTVDDGGVWNTLRAQVARRRRARRRRLRLAATTGVVVVALGLGALGTIHWWPHHEHILLITDDQTGATATEPSQAPPAMNAGWQQLSLPQTESTSYAYVTMDPTDPDVLFARTEAGLFVSRDAASSWTQLSAENVEMLVIDPGPPQALYGSIRDANGDVRLKKSVDDGATWTQVAASVEHFMGSFWVDTSTSPSTIYVQSLFKPGLLKSTDGGATWEGLGLEGGSELISPPSGSVLFAHTYEGDPSGYLRSSDGGATWEAIATTLPGVISGIMWTDPRDPSRRLYLSAVDEDLAPESLAHPGLVYVSSDAGETWSQADSSEQTWANMLLSVAPGTPPAAISEAAAFLAAPPGTVTDSATGASLNITGSVVIDPRDPSILYATAQKTNLGIGGIYKSTDQGATWINTTAAIKTKPFVWAVAIDPQNPETIYVNTWGSVLKSADAGVSWTSVFTDNPGLSLAVAPSSPSTLYIPTMPKPARSDDGGASWTEMTAAGLWSESTSEIADDEPYRRLLVASGSPETLLAFSGSEIYRSSDGGQNWAKAADLPRFDYMLGGEKLTPLKATLGDNLVVAAPGAPSTFYAILSDDSEHFILGPFGLSRSTDGGQTWTHLGGLKKDDGQFYFPVALGVRDGVTVYARRALSESQAGFAFQNDGIWRSDDGGSTWTRLAGEGLPVSQPAALFVDPWARDTLYTAGDWNDPEQTTVTIYRSTDRGDSWQDIGDLQLPAVGGYLTRLVPAPGGVLYAVGPRGVFKWVP